MAQEARSSQLVSITCARSEEQFAEFKTLSIEYTDWLGVNLDFQNFSSEVESLPGCYAEPRGCILLAQLVGGGSAGSGEAGPALQSAHPAAAASPPAASASPPPAAAVVGGVAVRPLDHVSRQQPFDGAPVCEVKRLYVRPSARGRGAARALVAAALREARARRYAWVVLDTLERLEGANRVYAAAGFERCGAYYPNPLPGVVYWRLRL